MTFQNKKSNLDIDEKLFNGNIIGSEHGRNPTENRTLDLQIDNISIENSFEEKSNTTSVKIIGQMNKPNIKLEKIE